MLDSRPRVNPADVARMHQAADLAVDGARVAVNDEDGFVGRTDEIGAEEAGAGNWTIRSSPLGQVAVKRFTNSRDNVHFS